MKHIGKAGRVAAAMVLAVAGSQVPQWLQADDSSVRSPFSSPTTAPAGWQLKNPDATYAIASDMCSALPASLLAIQAMSNDPDQAKSAIDQLRDEGPAGLDALLKANEAEVAAHRGGGFAVFFGKPDNNWPKIRAAIDAVAAQHDAYSSGLYWYTDFAKAQAASRASGKAILSLRLLGNLNDEFSCANSRFFRTVLYANAEVSKELREKFILHWQSVRPVPVITIDFGDGRKIRRTITGNSIHYVLTSDGKVVDGIPGLYGPKAFLRALEEAEKEVASLPTDGSANLVLTDWHMRQDAKISAAFATDVMGITQVTPTTPQLPQTFFSMPQPSPSFVVTPDFRFAMAGAPTTANISDAEWTRLADRHAEDAALDQGSLALMAAKAPDAATAARRAMSKMYVETPLIRAMRNFQRSIAEDTVRNEYLFHLQIHRWLADPANVNLVDDVAALNKKVYAELFLTPDSDPWLGLVPADTYSALDDDGICH